MKTVFAFISFPSAVIVWNFFFISSLMFLVLLIFLSFFFVFVFFICFVLFFFIFLCYKIFFLGGGGWGVMRIVYIKCSKCIPPAFKQEVRRLSSLFGIFSNISTGMAWHSSSILIRRCPISLIFTEYTFCFK